MALSSLATARLTDEVGTESVLPAALKLRASATATNARTNVRFIVAFSANNVLTKQRLSQTSKLSQALTMAKALERWTVLPHRSLERLSAKVMTVTGDMQMPLTVLARR